jgi:hypothetical protein
MAPGRAPPFPGPGVSRGGGLHRGSRAAGTLEGLDVPRDGDGDLMVPEATGFGVFPVHAPETNSAVRARAKARCLTTLGSRSRPGEQGRNGEDHRPRGQSERRQRRHRAPRRELADRHRRRRPEEQDERRRVQAERGGAEPFEALPGPRLEGLSDRSGLGVRLGRVGLQWSRSCRYATRFSMGIRSWAMLSRSRTVTWWSPSESKSTVTQKGVPTSSCLR